MDEKKLGKADINGIMEIEEKTVIDIFVERMRRAHKYLIEEAPEKSETLVEAEKPEIKPVKKPAVKKSTTKPATKKTRAKK
jgi:phage terminase small subunit